MRKQHVRWSALSLVMAAGCTSGGGSNDLEFHGEQPAVPGFMFDTGLKPASSPVQLQLKLSLAGTLTGDVLATAGGDGDATAVIGTPGSGSFNLDAHVKLEGTLHIDVQGGLKYDGPIPGIENAEIAFAGATMFDPFLLGGSKATVMAAIPEIELPPIPLPGGLPGTLVITVANGSVLTSTLSGVCAGFHDHTAQYKASTATSGTLVLKPRVIIKIPVIGDKTFTVPTVTVPISAVDAAMDLGSLEFTGGGDVPAGTAMMTKDGCSAGGTGSGSGSGGGGGGGGTGVCEPHLATPYVPVWHPPSGSHAGACTTAQLQGFAQSCLSATATAATCQAFAQHDASCNACILTDSTSPDYGPFVRYPNYVPLNTPGCVALRSPSQLSCAKSMQAYTNCIVASCSSCEAFSPDQDACFQKASTTTCAAYTSAADACDATNSAGAAASCYTDTAATLALFCGP